MAMGDNGYMVAWKLVEYCNGKTALLVGATTQMGTVSGSTTQVQDPFGY